MTVGKSYKTHHWSVDDCVRRIKKKVNKSILLAVLYIVSFGQSVLTKCLVPTMVMVAVESIYVCMYMSLVDSERRHSLLERSASVAMSAETRNDAIRADLVQCVSDTVGL